MSSISTAAVTALEKPVGPAFTPAQRGLLQRRCACRGTPGPTGECAECRKKRLGLRRKAKSRAATPTTPPVVYRVLRSTGRPLDHATRAFMEERFGHDFGQVKVHTDAEAAESARSVHSLAYTVGRNVVFGSGQYAPHTLQGRKLLAHELTHVVQQDSQPSTTLLPLSIGPQDDSETVAERIADRVMTGVPVTGRIQGRGASIQRQTVPEPESAERRPGQPLPYREAMEELARDRLIGGDRAQEPAREESKKVCFTYDDGPQKGTEDVLDAHSSSGVPATFFLTGKNMEKNPTLQKRLVERMLNEGHQIGNHTFTHDPQTLRDYKRVYGDLSDPTSLKKFRENFEKNEQYFRNLLGATSGLFTLARLPGDGRLVEANGKLILVLATEEMGMIHVAWQFEFGPNGSFAHLKALDWKGVKGVAAEVNRFPNPNDVILLHDRHWSGRQVLLKAIFDKLSAAGFTFGRLDASGKCS